MASLLRGSRSSPNGIRTRVATLREPVGPISVETTGSGYGVYCLVSGAKRAFADISVRWSG